MTQTIDHLDAAADALVAYLRGWFDDRKGEGVVTVVRGWPDFATETSGETTEQARVAVVPGPTTRVGAKAHAVHSTLDIAADEDGVEHVEIRYQTGTWKASVQVNAFTEDREGRDEMIALLTEALSPDLPDDSALTLTVASYYNDRVRFMDASDSIDGDNRAAIAGRWRHLRVLNGVGNLVVPKTYAKTTSITFDINDVQTVVE